jgi:5-methylcytosine-specific restriction enzyme subunit McrC
MQGVALEEFADTLHLFSHLLVLGVRTIYRRGLETGYIGRQESVFTIRGRILVDQTIRLQTSEPSRVFCMFDDLSTDTLTNQILKSTLTRLLGEESLEGDVRAKLRQAIALLPNVQNIKLNPKAFHEVRLHRNNRLYLFLINICRLFYECLEAQDRPGIYRFREVERDEKRMRRVFEKFVRNFFSCRQTIFSVKKEQTDWCASAIDNSDLKWLPKMVTDVNLRSDNRTIIIECKYTASLFQKRYSSHKLRSTHLYQLCAYLRNLEDKPEPDRSAEGLLLYPTAGIELDQSYNLQGHRVRVKTLNLNQSWMGIERDMLALLEPIRTA